MKEIKLIEFIDGLKTHFETALSKVRIIGIDK
jgi:hypothetical protein